VGQSRVVSNALYTNVVGQLALDRSVMEKEKIKDIADNLEFGMRCFIHSKSKEIKFIPDHDKHPDMDSEIFAEDDEEIENNFRDYIRIEGMNSHESFKVMRDFIETVDNEVLRERLIHALNRPKPFSNFKFTIDNSGQYRDRWFKFKDKKIMDWVENQLQENGL
jgi:hypothetical protein